MSGEADHGSRLNESGAARRDTSLPTATSPRLSRPTGFNGHASVGSVRLPRISPLLRAKPVSLNCHLFRSKASHDVP